MVKAIIFDFLGVFTLTANFNAFRKKYSQVYKVDKKQFSEKIHELWNKAKISESDSEKYWTELSRFTNVSEEQLQDDVNGFLGFRNELFDLVKNELKGKYTLGILSNHIESWFEPLLDRHHVRDLFDVIVTSYNVRFAKPDIRIYEQLIKQLKIEPVQCLYIDDLERNIIPAKRLGMKTIQFTTMLQIESDLRSIGIL